MNREKRIREFLRRRQFFLQGFGVGDDKYRFFVTSFLRMTSVCHPERSEGSFHQLTNGGRALHPQGGFIIAALHTLSGLRKKENTVSLN